MALETLKGVKQVNGFNIVQMDELRKTFPERFHESGAMDHTWFESDIRPNFHIYVRHDKNSVSFTLQNGPVKAHGINGCQVDEMIGVAKAILEGLNKQFACRENAIAITKLEEAMHWLKARKTNREARGVEGTNEQ